MKGAIGVVTTVAVLLGLMWAGLAGATKPADQSERGTADELFREGRFAAAEEAYRRALESDGRDGEAALRLGELALLGNRFAEAEPQLKQALELLSDKERAQRLLAELHCRRDEFAPAAKLLRATGRTARADQLASFAGVTPYQIVGDAEVTHVKFKRTDPLPLVRARINGAHEVSLLIDTGGPELVLNTAVAEKVGARRFAGEERGTFAGGRRAPIGHGRIDSIELGEFTVQQVPVMLMDLPGLPGMGRIDGIIGTVLLYHFVPTLDYPDGQLVLRRKTEQTRAYLDKLERDPEAHTVPFWMAGQHWIIAQGKVNKAGPYLLHVDTGLAGGGFSCPESTLKEAGIDLTGLPSFEGIGGGGPIEITPFTVDKLTLGGLVQREVPASFAQRPPGMEYAMGFRIGGLISHAFFRPYAVTLDFERMQMLLTPGE